MKGGKKRRIKKIELKNKLRRRIFSHTINISNDQTLILDIIERRRRKKKKERK